MTTRKKKAAPKTFKAAYATLKKNAETLQASNEPDIDNLMTTVEQSIAAYKVCQARIEAVQKALDAAFDEDAMNGNDFSNNFSNNEDDKTNSESDAADDSVSGGNIDNNNEGDNDAFSN